MRLFDIECKKCGEIEEDVFSEDLPRLHCGAEMSVIWRRAPMVDAKMPFYVHGLKKHFSSHLQMERYARSKGKTVMEGKKAVQLPHDTVEERLEKNLGERRREAIAKTHYRLKHGYQDHPPLDKE